jgi:hypothetical protein
MSLLPSKIRHIPADHPDFGWDGRLICVDPENNIWINLVARVQGKGRVLATSRPDDQSYAALDIHIGHGWLTTPLFWLSGATGSQIFYTSDENGVVTRTAIHRSRQKSTHAHILTAGRRHYDFPQSAPYNFNYDFFIVNGYFFDGEQFHLCDTGARTFGTNDCPFVIPASWLSDYRDNPMCEKETFVEHKSRTSCLIRYFQSRNSKHAAEHAARTVLIAMATVALTIAVGLIWLGGGMHVAGWLTSDTEIAVGGITLVGWLAWLFGLIKFD